MEEVEDNPDFYFLRRPEINPKLKLERRLELLWRPELSLLLERFELPAYKGLGKPFVRKKLMEFTKTPLSKAAVARIKKAAKDQGIEPIIPEYKVDKDELRHEISEILFERDEEALLAQIKEFRKAKNPRRRGTKKSTNVRRIRKLAKRSK